MSEYPAALWRAPRMTGLIERTRLFTDSAAAIEIVTGPSGIGKTAYLLQAASSRGARIAWVRCTASAGSAADVVALAHRSLGVDLEPSSGDPLVLAGELLALLEAEPTVLVVDDLHEADHRTVDPLLAETAALIDPISSILTASRPRPTALIGRVARFARVVDSDDLRFDQAETEQLFNERGWPTTEVDRWLSETGGWAVALDLASTDVVPTEGGPGSLLAQLVAERVGEPWSDVVGFAACPYLTDEIARAIGLEDPDRLPHRLPVSTTAGRTVLPDAVRDAVLRSAEPATVEAARRRARDAFLAVDPAAAVEILVELDEVEAAADLLNGLIGTISIDAAVNWAYRLPPTLRHRLPPAITGGRATVNPDLAELTALERLELADDPEEEASASFALASVRTAQSRLDEAAELLDTVLATAAEPSLRSGALGLQALVRWWLGDVGGARASHATDGASAWSAYVDAMIALAEHDDDRAAASARRAVELAADDGAESSLGMAAEALVHAVGGDRARATDLAEQAWATALEPGGFELGAAGVASLWLLAAGDDSARAAAPTRAREVEARVGPRDPYARAGVAMARAHIAADDPDDAGRAERRLAAIRAVGFGPVAAVFDRLVGESSAASAGLRIELLGDGEMTVDGVPLDLSAWKSRKSVEIARYLAYRGGACRREEVIEAIWPERPPDKGKALLRNALTEVRAGLEPDRRAGEDSRFLVADRTTVRLAASTDLQDAERAAEGAALALLRRASLPDLDAEWAEEISRVRDRLLAEEADRIRRNPAHPDRRLALEALVSLEPWNRTLVDELIVALQEEGDDAGAAAVERRWFEDD